MRHRPWPRCDPLFPGLSLFPEHLLYTRRAHSSGLPHSRGRRPTEHCPLALPTAIPRAPPRPPQLRGHLCLRTPFLAADRGGPAFMVGRGPRGLSQSRRAPWQRRKGQVRRLLSSSPPPTPFCFKAQLRSERSLLGGPGGRPQGAHVVGAEDRQRPTPKVAPETGRCHPVAEKSSHGQSGGRWRGAHPGHRREGFLEGEQLCKGPEVGREQTEGPIATAEEQSGLEQGELRAQSGGGGGR